MGAEQQIEETFRRLEGAPEPLQALLRPVVVRVMQDPDTLRLLGSHALVDHVMFVGSVLLSWAATSPEDRLRLPSREETFLNITIGRPFEDVEEAFAFVMALADTERRDVATALRAALDIASPRQNVFSLLAVARLLRLALVNAENVQHIGGGGKAEPLFSEDASTRNAVATRGVKQKSRRIPAPARPRDPGASWLGQFRGQLVQVVVAMPAPGWAEGHGHLEPSAVVYLGWCLEVAPTYIVLDVRPGEDDGPDPVVIGFNSVVQMRPVPAAVLGTQIR